jgi:enoyl-CoA hydratase/carnithine racemase
MSEALVLVEKQGPVAHLRLNRPDKLNALSMEMVEELHLACLQIDEALEIRVAILSGNGKGFCAGGDIHDWSEFEPAEFGRRWLRDGHRAFDALARLRQPVIAVLDGHVLGGGLELASCADLRIAEEHVLFGQPETGLGMIPGWSGTQRTVRRFGSQVVRRMALMGEILTAKQALSHGIVDQVVATGEGNAAALEVAERLLSRGPRASELVKMMINAAEGEERERVIDVLAGTAAASDSELKEGLAAFKARRPPNF